MPRGCVTVLEPGTYAADGIKHAIKPVDMTGQSAALILRQIHPEVRHAAENLRLDDTGDWFSLLSLQDGALSHRAATRLREQEHVVLMQCQQVVAAAMARVLQSHRCDLARQRVETATARQCHELVRRMVSAVAREVAGPTRIGGGAWRGNWEHNPYAPSEVMTYEEGRQWRCCAGVVREAVWATMRLERQEEIQRGLAEKQQLRELRSFVGDIVREVEREAYNDSNAVATVVGDLVATVADRTGKKPRVAHKKREYLKRRRPREWPRSPAEWKRLTRDEQDAWYALQGGQGKAIQALNLKREPWSLMSRFHFAQTEREHVTVEEQDARCEVQREREKLISGVVARAVRDVEREAYDDSNAVATVVGDLVATLAGRTGRKPRLTQKKKPCMVQKKEAHEAQKKRENRRRPKDWPRSPAEWKRLTRQEQDAWYKKNRPSWWVSSNVRTYWTQPNFPKVQAKPEAEVGTVIGLTEEEVERIRLEARLEREALINSCYAAAAEQT